MRVLVVNAGSTSVKLRVLDDGDRVVGSADLGPPGPDLAGPVRELLDRAGPVDAVGHRVVHGGPDLTGPVVVDAEVRARLERLSDLAPLHNPPALAALDAVSALTPGVGAVACFDTSFHLAGMPSTAAAYALPADWSRRWPEARRYGFHGLSVQWSTERAAGLLGRPVGELRVVVAHLGGGASVTAVHHGRSADTTMGFTPLAGVPMATRSGDVDPGLVLWLASHGLSLDELSEGLERRAGLLGLSGGRIGDLRELIEWRDTGDREAAAAVATYVMRVRGAVAAMAAAAQGAEAVVFTGGVGEHAEAIRSEVCAGLGWMGVEADRVRNAAVTGDAEISPPGAPVRVLVVRAREDVVVARAARALLGG